MADTVELTVNVELLEADKDGVQRQGDVYAFTSGGRLIGRAKIGDRGQAVLRIRAPGEPMSAHIVAGPASEEKAPPLSELLRRGGERIKVRIDPEDLKPSHTITIIPEKWRCWLFSACFVPGTLMKRAELDGIPSELPVCGAEIEVFEVDPLPLIIARLPDERIDALRRRLLDPPPRRIDVRLPETRRPPLPRPPGPASRSIALAADLDMSAPAMTPRSLGDAPQADIPADLQIAAESASAHQFREALVRAPDIARLLLCRHFPGGVTTQLVATAKTDECGRFRAVFFRGCVNPDTPDLYFKAFRRIGPVRIEIFGPTPIACYTHWNYTCGTPVELKTVHPLAHTCPPCQPIEAPVDDWVAVMHIGNTPLSRIRGASPNAAVQASTTSDNTGLGFMNEGEALAAGSFDGRPFGGLLRPHVEFDNGLRAKGVRYYQFSWRAGDSGAFQPLTYDIHRHYSFEPPGATEPVFQVYPLGPFEIGGRSLFEIPPALPPSGQWVVTDLVENQTSAKFPTNTLAPAASAGKHQLKLDLFDAAGNLIDIDVLGLKFVVPEELNLALPATIHTADAEPLGLVFDDDGDGLKSFIMNLHVDNATCTAEIEPAMLAGPATPCGVLLYDAGDMSASVSMPFTALHERSFATYSFTLKRGVTNLSAMAIGGADPLTDPRAAPPGDFEQTASVDALTGPYPALGLPGCSVGAFSGQVRTWAMAINGWRRLHEYDAIDHGAFVLTPAETP